MQTLFQESCHAIEFPVRCVDCACPDGVVFELRRARSPPAAKDSSPASPAVPGATPIVGGAAADENAGLKELDEADRKAAEKQKTCPVSGAKLGAMGTPYKVTVKGRTSSFAARIVCPELDAHPDKYLKKLKD